MRARQALWLAMLVVVAIVLLTLAVQTAQAIDGLGDRLYGPPTPTPVIWW